MKVALLADIHGNSIALDAVLAEIHASGGADEFWILGDLVAIGPDPVGVLERLDGLANARFLRGNTDRYVADGGQPWPDFSDSQRDPALLPLHIRVARSFAWTTGAVGATGWLPWLAQMPLEFRLELPGGTSVLAVHAAPGTDDGFGLHPHLSDEELAASVAAAGADLVLVGHTHSPFDRTVGGIRVVNPGSVSNPFPPDLRACYALLEADERGYSLTLKRVDYDRQAVIAAVKEVNHPSAGYIASFMQGQVKKDWMK